MVNQHSPSRVRLLFLRAVYALLAFGMGSQIWPGIMTGSGDWALMPGVVKCMLGAMTLLALIGIWRPLQMLPLLFWEIGWKLIWLLAVAMPLWFAGTMDADHAQTAIEVAVVVIVIVAVPWQFVTTRFFTQPLAQD